MEGDPKIEVWDPQNDVWDPKSEVWDLGAREIPLTLTPARKYNYIDRIEILRSSAY